MNAYDQVTFKLLDERERQLETWGYPQKAMRNLSDAMMVIAEEFGEACKEVVEFNSCPNGHPRREEILVALQLELTQTAACIIQLQEHILDGYIKP